MKLKELLEEIFRLEHPKENKIGILDDILYGEEQLEKYKEKLLQCEEFSECTELNFLKTPILAIDDKQMVIQSYRLLEGQKFKGKGYLLSIMLTPEMYDPNTMYGIIKDGASITPTVYDPNTFEPHKKIILQFNPDRKQDGITNHEAVIRQELHDLLDKVLDNPDTFRVKGDRSVLVRGIFERNEIVKEVEPPKYLIGNIDTEPKYAQVYYWEKKTKNGEISMKLVHKNIPIKLVDKFNEELGDKGINITEEEINEFLEKYK